LVAEVMLYPLRFKRGYVSSPGRDWFAYSIP
jgi:hypothetical protein